MKKLITAFSFAMLILPVLCTVAGAAEFFHDLAFKAFEFVNAEDASVIEGNDGWARIRQKENTIVVEFESGGNGSLVFFKTRDPEMVFPGDVKVGGSLSAFLKAGAMEGEATELKAPGGQKAYRWNIYNEATLTVYAREDVITEFVYYDPEEQGSGDAYVDVTTLNYK
jgi:hypothetical protein